MVVIIIITIKEIYEKVNLVVPIEQRRFFNFMQDSVNELEAKYSYHVFEPKTNYTPPKSLTDKFTVLPIYYDSIVDNIIFLETKEEMYKSEFLRKARDAYLKYWNDKAKGKKIKTKGW